MAKYTLHGRLPDGPEMVIRSMVDREEAESMADVLCRVIEDLERHDGFNSAPRREGNSWYVRSKNWRRDGALLCWLEEVEGKMLDHFQRFETTNPKVGLSVMYELKRNPTVLATAYVEGVHLGRATLPLDVWELVLGSKHLNEKYGLTTEEVAELGEIWKDFEAVATTQQTVTVSKAT